MCSSDEFPSFLNDPLHLTNLLKEKSDLILADSTFSHIANHFLSQPISIKGLAVQRNLYGRPRSSSLDQYELDLLIYNIKGYLHSNSEELTEPVLQYLHNINRLLPNDFVILHIYVH
ncbi:unnamed protein product [Rotaria magnacalcarata]|uniref:Uncharacterized protein n=1 Tax=Rotaria magnacalcarata TaxID=392030 RepID=A0A816UHN5_9BILA|nr:unnamed protein product [Rotaria magnacalcarata]CAF1599258.1 unnamed protein product [Rotaria magnacalcarata]CAF2102444.1 unnamed protein product [Rotaria magnacalcarata]CAF2125906.1 unnamed protein product [Rotaria magnacalcarata]CAF4301683.1 unnamed protein product [Rotaria magnacalcarata]